MNTTLTSSTMGWWHPYFFTDTTDVQLLLPSLRIDGTPASLTLALTVIFLLCLLDRWAVARSASARGTPFYIPWFFLQRLAGGLVMLVMMSFNVVLFGATLVSLAVCELIVAGSTGVCGGRGGDERTGVTPKTYEMVVTDG